MASSLPVSDGHMSEDRLEAGGTEEDEHLQRPLRRGRWTPKAESCASVCSSAANALAPPRPATRAARISATARSGVIVWKKDGLSVATRMVLLAIWASGETSESVRATTRTPRSAA